MKKTFLNCLKYFALFTLTLVLHAKGVSDETSAPSSVRLAGHVPSKAIAHSILLGQLDADEKISFTITLPLRNQKVLEKLLQRIYDPSDQQYYGKYLTSAEFIEQFAPTEEDYHYVMDHMQNLGFTVSGTHPNRTLLNLRADVRSIASAFNLNLFQYQHENGRIFYGPDNDPAVDVSIASKIRGVLGLDNFAQAHPCNRCRKVEETLDAPKLSSFPSGPNNTFAPQDIKLAYNLTKVSENGSGQIIALFELATYDVSDINVYTNYFGLPSAKLTSILVDGGASNVDIEVVLDIELVVALAPESEIYVYEAPNDLSSIANNYNRIATDNLAQQISTSWTVPEYEAGSNFLESENAIFQQMAAQGQTIYNASGDTGPYPDSGTTTVGVNDPASQPYVTGVGGTTLKINTTTGAYESEVVWNFLGASGGGVSSYWLIPYWQQNTSTTYSKTYRNVPDVALNTDTVLSGYSIYYAGAWYLGGGTSASAPLWAAFTALVNQKRAAIKKSRLGFVNPIICSIGNSSTYTTNFHDITQGSNIIDSEGYYAGVGYDNATGWGSFNGINLFFTLVGITPDSRLVRAFKGYNSLQVLKGGF